MNINLKRPAIAMIELIFAIVIMGIVMMSAPMLISTAVQSSSVALQQAGISEAASRISMILTHEWDQNDLNDSCTPPTLHVSSTGDSDLNEVGTTFRRIGVPQDSDSHTFRCGNSELNATMTVDGKDDIDDFTNPSSLILDTSGSGGKDYIEKTTVSIATAVYYAPDSATYNSTSFAYGFTPNSIAGDSTNIKAISVTLTSTSSVDELKKTIKLHAFSCNLGGYQYEWRQLP